MSVCHWISYWVGLGRGNGGRRTYPQYLHGIERVLPPSERAEHHKSKRRGRSAELECQEVLDIVEDALALFDRGEDCGEIVVGEDHIRRFLGDVRAQLTHRDADVCFLQGGGVVHAVAGHGYHVASRLQGSDDFEFVLGTGSGKDADSAHGFCELGVAHGVYLIATEDWRAKRRGQVDRHSELARDCCGGGFGVSCDHDDLDTAGQETPDAAVDAWARRIGHAHQTSKGESSVYAFGAVGIDGGQGSRGTITG